LNHRDRHRPDLHRYPPSAAFADWNPRPDTLDRLRVVNGVLQEYRAQLPLTNRQIFYRLVGAHGYDKTEKAYARLSAKYLQPRPPAPA